MNKQKLYMAIGLLILTGWFYWFQWRPSEIRKQCFREVYSENTNTEWAEGKEWMYYKNDKWAWLYPYWHAQSESDIYRGCLLYNGLK